MLALPGTEDADIKNEGGLATRVRAGFQKVT